VEQSNVANAHVPAIRAAMAEIAGYSRGVEPAIEIRSVGLRHREGDVIEDLVTCHLVIYLVTN